MLPDEVFEETSSFRDIETSGLLDGYPLVKMTDGGVRSDSSEASAGYLPKWIQYCPDGKYLIKASSLDPKSSPLCKFESESESLSSAIADIVGIAHVHYELLESTGDLPAGRSYCRSPWFLKDNQESRSLYRIMRSDPELNPLLEKKPFALVVDKITAKLNLRGFSDYVKDMLVFDYLINNPDRHFRNIEILHGAEGYSLPPIFDHGNALFGEYSDDVLRTMPLDNVSGDYRQSKGFFDDHWKALNRLKLVGLPLELITKIISCRDAITEEVRKAELSLPREAVLINLLEQRMAELEIAIGG